MQKLCGDVTKQTTTAFNNQKKKNQQKPKEERISNFQNYHTLIFKRLVFNNRSSHKTLESAGWEEKREGGGGERIIRFIYIKIYIVLIIYQESIVHLKE